MTKGQTILAAIIVGGFVIVSAIVFLTELMADWKGEVAMAWVLNFTTVVGYLFGSSKGSADKNKIITKEI